MNKYFKFEGAYANESIDTLIEQLCGKSDASSIKDFKNMPNKENIAPLRDPVVPRKINSPKMVVDIDKKSLKSNNEKKLRSPTEVKNELRNDSTNYQNLHENHEIELELVKSRKDKQIGELRSEIKHLKLNIAQSQNSEKKIQISKYLNEISDLKIQLDKLKDENDHLKKELNNYKAEKENIEQKLFDSTHAQTSEDHFNYKMCRDAQIQTDLMPEKYSQAHCVQNYVTASSLNEDLNRQKIEKILENNVELNNEVFDYYSDAVQLKLQFFFVS